MVDARAQPGVKARARAGRRRASPEVARWVDADHSFGRPMPKPRPDPVESRLDALHATPPGGFVALRNALARELARAHDPRAEDVARLPRPTLPVWAINLSASAEPGPIAGLLTAAQHVVKAYRLVLGGGGRDVLLEANDALARLVEQATSSAARSAASGGHPLSTDMLGRVRSTLRALALGDAEGRERLRAGRVVVESTETGLKTLASLEPIGVRPAARAVSAAPPRPHDAPARAVTDARAEAEAAERRLARATEAAQRLRREAAATQRRADESAARARDAEREVGQAAEQAREARARLVAGAQHDASRGSVFPAHRRSSADENPR